MSDLLVDARAVYTGAAIAGLVLALALVYWAFPDR